MKEEIKSSQSCGKKMCGGSGRGPTMIRYLPIISVNTLLSGLFTIVGSKVSCEQIILHPIYCSANAHYDIGLLPPSSQILANALSLLSIALPSSP